MDADFLSQRIGLVEDELETVADAMARSRRLVLLSRGAAWAGGAWLLAGIVGVAPWNALGLVSAVAAVIGGVVFAGSSVATIRELEARRAKLAELRDSLIDVVSPTPLAHEPDRQEPDRHEPDRHGPDRPRPALSPGR